MFLMGDQTSVENDDRHVSADHDPDLRLVWILALSLATTQGMNGMILLSKTQHNACS